MHRLIFTVLIVILSVIQLQAQQTTHDQLTEFDMKRIEAEVTIQPYDGSISGNIKLEFEILKEADTLKIDGREMQFEKVMLNGGKVDFTRDDTGIYIISNFKPSYENIIQLNYSAEPKTAMYFINWEKEFPATEKQVWTQGQGKYTSNWLPSFDEMQEKTEFDITYNFHADYQLIANGILKNRSSKNDSITSWNYDMQEPMSSYLVAMAAGRFDSITSVSNSGIPMIMYYRPQDSQKAEPTYRYSTEIFDFFEKEIGVPYAWQNYKQIPAMNFLYGGMENTGTTIFAESMVTDSIGFNDQNYLNVNAHELAHQWFGDLVTEKTGKHHWLNEGFSTYYALLAEKEIFGDDYYYWKLYQTAEQLKELSDKGEGQSLVRTGNSSLTYYQKGAWALHILRELIGDEAFRDGIKNYLSLYSFKNAETDEFLSEMEMASGQDLSQFKKDWLEQSAFKATQALESLKKSEFIKQYLLVAALRETPMDQKYDYLNQALDFPVNDYIGQEVVHQLSGNNSENAMRLYEKALETGNIYVRQAVAETLEKIPQNLKKDFESLLEDDSYITKEAALFKLWSSFPESRPQYFEELEEVNGFYNKNVRMLWLTLNLVSPNYETDKNQQYYEELAGYTSSWQPVEVQKNAFSYLYQIAAFNENSLKSLIKGTTHFNYHFRDYCRELLSELLSNSEYRDKIIAISENMGEDETRFLKSKIEG